MEIENYISTLNSEYTKKSYRNFLIKTNKELNLDTRNVDRIKEYIESLNIAEKTKQDKHYIIQGYLNYTKRPMYNFNKEPIVKKLKRVLPIRNSLKTKIEIENTEHKLVLNLLLNYPQVFRTDLANIKLTDIKNGVIHFEKLRKTLQKNKVIELSKEDNLLVEKLKGEFLINSIKSKDRNNAYTKYIKAISKKYFGFELTQTDFRKMSAQESFEESNLTKETIENLIKFKKSCENRGHNFETCLKYYVDY